MRFVRHCKDIEDEEDDELGCLDYVARSGDDEAVLIQERGTARVIQADVAALVSIRHEIKPGCGGISDAAAPDGVDDFLAGGSCEEDLAF